MIKILFLEVFEEYIQWENEDYGNVREERKDWEKKKKKAKTPVASIIDCSEISINHFAGTV